MKQRAPSSPTLDEASCVYGAGVLLKHIQALREETAGVQAGSEDIEFIHRARVASRRLRAALPLFQSCLPPKKSAGWMKEIRQVTRALGEARDADVQIERMEKYIKKLENLPLADATRCRPGLMRLRLRLRQKRQRLQAPVSEAMQRLAESQVLDEMAERLQAQADRAKEIYIYTPVLYGHSFNAIHTRLEDFLAYEPIVEQPEKVEELHEMRIAAKWLRYTLEAFAPLYSSHFKPHLQAVKQAQETLGDIHDCDVWTTFIPTFLEEERQRTLEYMGHTRPVKRFIYGIQSFEQDRRRAREEQYQQFVSDWRKWREAAIWQDLQKTIQVPFLQIDQIYPPKLEDHSTSGSAGS